MLNDMILINCVEKEFMKELNMTLAKYIEKEFIKILYDIFFFFFPA